MDVVDQARMDVVDQAPKASNFGYVLPLSRNKFIQIQVTYCRSEGVYKYDALGNANRL